MENEGGGGDCRDVGAKGVTVMEGIVGVKGVTVMEGFVRTTRLVARDNKKTSTKP
jgi:hypothetical protein